MRYSVSTTTDFDHAIFDPQIGAWWLKQNITAYQGLCQVRADRDTFFGGAKSRDYRSEVLLNPTWRQLFLLAKQQQKATNDFQHDFFEGYAETGKVDRNLHPNHLPVHIIKLILGS